MRTILKSLFIRYLSICVVGIIFHVHSIQASTSSVFDESAQLSHDFSILYAPWREHYMMSSSYPEQRQCPFCVQLGNDVHDESYFILKRFKYHAVFLNLFPYSKGHLLIVPYAHKATLQELEQESRYELIDLIAFCCEALKKAFNAPGFNVGINFGHRCAGCSIPEHVHVHIIPRSIGDSSFMMTTAQTFVISYDLTRVYRELKPYFA